MFFDVLTKLQRSLGTMRILGDVLRTVTLFLSVLSGSFAELGQEDTGFGAATDASLFKAAVFDTEDQGRHHNNTIKVMSYNIQNFDSGAPWASRKHLVAQVIRDEEPAVVAVQEVRTRDGRSQALELAELLSPKYALLRDTAMEYEDGSTEGLALYTTLPIRLHHSTSLGSSYLDLNERVCQHAALALPTGGVLDVFHTHLSYDRSTQVASLERLMDCLSLHREGSVQLLLGDLNTHSDYRLVAEVLTGLHGEIPGGPFTDLWEAVHSSNTSKDPDFGLTFSTSKLITRCDYIMARGSFTPILAKTLGDVSLTDDGGSIIAASDHLALLVEIALS
ncbi:hypothetical protein CYMTET_52172 [Cymbomonas tetramitiformis]|uniref:Endonuclease/exonuclease/phosphatase domain-containing protein n=1 Tax=Cymbomonas tetramitiformis TaxID=36881 RepID=A0AAE0ERC6_9CHLO|nr:hypothetical protein CYMTET_52172 [Cymbomonas tetramitiformis]